MRGVALFEDLGVRLRELVAGLAPGCFVGALDGRAFVDAAAGDGSSPA
jgi:hypothetical protein